MFNKFFEVKQLSSVLPIIPDPSAEAIDYIIKSHHRFLLFKKSNKSVLISIRDYISITKLAPKRYLVLIKHNKSRIAFEINADNGDDIFGSSSYDDILQHCDDNTDMWSESEYKKIIFSPHLVKFLLERRFRIIDIKRRDGGTLNEWLPVFLVEPGFYEAIEEFKNNKNK